MNTTTMTNERTNAELIQAIRDEDKGLGEHAMLSARLIHNTVTVMQAAYLEWKVGKGAEVAMEWIENTLDDTDNIPAEGYAGAGDMSHAHSPQLYFTDNHLSGELSPYQSRMTPLIDDLERRMVCLQKRMDLMTAERDHWKANHDNRVNAAKILMDRTDMPLERVGAYKHYVAALEATQKLRERAESAEAELLAVREDNHSMMMEIHSLRIERDALAAELAKLREQKPVAWMHDKDGRVDTCHDSVKKLWIKAGQKQNTQFMREIVPCRVEHYNIPLYAAPAPAAPAPTPFIPDDDTRRNDAEFAGYCANRAVLNGSPGGLIESGGCAPAVIAAPSPPEVAAKFWIASGECGKCGQPFSVPGPMVEAAPNVPEEWREFVSEVVNTLRYAGAYDMAQKARALLQSSDHSGEVKP